MSFIKTRLKAARDAIAQQNYDYANDVCQSILENDPENYNALVFAGLSLKELLKHKESESHYQRAIKVNQDQPLAYQGLSKLYDSQGLISEQFDVTAHLARIFYQSKDYKKLYETMTTRLELLDKLLHQDKSLESITRASQALKEYLPNSAIYGVISEFGSLLSPLEIFQKQLQLYTTYKNDYIKTQVQKRRTRLGAGTLTEITFQVEKEAFVDSPIDSILNEIINLDLDEDKRMTHTVELLEFVVKKIVYVEDKRNLRVVLDQLKDYIVDCGNSIIAFKLYLDENLLPLLDIDTSMVDIDVLNETGYENFVSALMNCKESKWTDALADVLLGLEINANSIFGNRLRVFILLKLGDWNAVIEVGQTYLNLANLYCSNYDISFEFPIMEVEISVAVAMSNLDEFQVVQSIDKFQSILEKVADNIDVLLYLGQALLKISSFDRARECFDKVLELDPTNQTCISDIGWCLYLKNQYEEALDKLKEALSIKETHLVRYRLAKVYWKLGGEHQKETQSQIVQAIKLDSTFSPSFTLLGDYFAEIEGDFERASKCYSKAISINPTDSQAVRQIINIWIPKTKIKESIDLLNQYLKYDSRSARAWKQLGILTLNAKEYNEACNYFQSSLRINSKDAVCWKSLGEGYLLQGKYVAALKSLVKALEFDPESTSAMYFTAIVNQKLGLFGDSIKSFETVLGICEQRGLNAFAVVKGLSESLVLMAKDAYENGAFGQCLHALGRVVEVAVSVFDGGSRETALLKIVGDSCVLLYNLVPYLVNDKVFEHVERLIDALKTVFDKSLTALGLLDQEAFIGLSRILQLAEICFQLTIIDLTKQGKPNLLSAAHSDLSIALFLLSKCSPSMENSTANPVERAQKYCKIGLTLNPENISCWLLLGVLNVESNPKLAQHCFIQVLNLDETNSTAWSNLGYFYLLHEDIDLARESFRKCQSIDPDLAHGWFGTGIVTESLGTGEHFKLFEHSYELAKISRPEMLYYFAYQSYLNPTCEKLVRDAALFALIKCSELREPDAAIHNLLGLFLEEQGHHQLSKKAFENSLEFCGDEVRHLVIENYARCLFNLQEYSESVEQYEICLQGDQDAYTLAGFGVALYFVERFLDSLGAFERALETSTITEKNDISHLLSQVLFVIGDEDHLEVAKQELFKCYNNDPGFVKAILSLCSIGLVLHDWTLAETAAAELLKLEPHLVVEYNDDMDLVLSRMFLLTKQRDTAKRFLAKSIHRSPWKALLWSRLAEYAYMFDRTDRQSIVLSECSYAIAMDASQSGLHAGVKSEDLASIYRVQGICRLASGKDKKSDISRALFMKPGDALNWIALSVELGSNDKDQLLLSKKCGLAAEKIAKGEDESNWASLLQLNAEYELTRKEAGEIELSETVPLLDQMATNSSGLVRQQAYSLLGRVLLYLGEFDMGLQVMKQTVSSVPAEPSNLDIVPLLDLGKFFVGNERPNAALKCFEYAIDLFPSILLPKLLSCAIYFQLHEFDKSQDILLSLTHSGQALRFFQTVSMVFQNQKEFGGRIKKNISWLEHCSCGRVQMEWLGKLIVQYRGE